MLYVWSGELGPDNLRQCGGVGPHSLVVLYVWSGELGPDNLRQCGGAGPHKVLPCCMCGGAGPHYILAFVAKGSWAL